MRPLSEAQRRAWDHGRLPDPELVAPDVWAIGVPIPGGTIPHTLCYVLVGDDGVHLIDPGWNNAQSVQALTQALSLIGERCENVRTIIATHFHPDHMGAASLFQRRYGARTVFSSAEAVVLQQEASAAAATSENYRDTLRGWGVPRSQWSDLERAFERAASVAYTPPDMAVTDGQILEFAGHRLTALITPGHTGGHLCLVDTDREVLYAGDHVLPRIFPGIGLGSLPGADSLGDYFASLERLGEYDHYAVLPGHEYGFTGLATRREQIIDHHLRRTAQVAALAERLGDAPAWEYAREMTWSSGWASMTGLWLHSALLQTALHREYVASGRAAARLNARAAQTPPQLP